ncbi:caspase family protein [Streptomyces yunnanensis]|uniref:Caspase domain-containing protein n=1 Tax=Streptomyces yunnanensis TaxID=156453 RepID=A0A9X8N9L4_9ACTN|nr:caspase family protein [Streptomyces yunnanensis]SHN34236.1 Caspase domain-containing protein [Streptomyces yunnanensis]
MSKGMSIHIGINEIDENKYGSKAKLKNPENDASTMAGIAEAQGFDVSATLLTKEATSEHVTAALKDAASQLTAGDILMLTYSGHGSQVPDKNGDEPDGKDETLVLFDRQFVDDELYALFGTFPEDVRILMLSDSCHSGTVARDLSLSLNEATLERAFDTSKPAEARARVRALPSDAQFRNYQRDQTLYDSIQKSLPALDQQEIKADVLLISGCQDNQTASDGTGTNGLFTQTLLRTWKNGAFQGTYSRLHRQIVKAMPAYQTPNLFQSGKSTPGFLAQTPFSI